MKKTFTARIIAIDNIPPKRETNLIKHESFAHIDNFLRQKGFSPKKELTFKGIGIIYIKKEIYEKENEPVTKEIKVGIF